MKTTLETLRDWIPQIPMNQGFIGKLEDFEAELLELLKNTDREPMSDADIGYVLALKEILGSDKVSSLKDSSTEDSKESSQEGLGLKKRENEWLRKNMNT